VIEPIPPASPGNPDLAQRRALLFSPLCFNELVRVPRGIEA